jgi:acyl-CoA dehydrogenase
MVHSTTGSNQLSDEERMLRDTVRGYLDAKVRPLVAPHERSRTLPWHIVPDLYQFGYVRGVVSDGPDTTSHMVQALLMEEAGRCWGSLRTTLNVQSMVARLLSTSGTPQQREQFLAPQLAGARFGWFGVTEPDAGSDAAIRTTARRDGEHYVVTGRKMYITNALGCDFGILLVKVVDEEPGGVTALLVDRAESPYTAHDIPHMPVRATSSCELVFDQVRVPVSHVLGEVGRGLATVMAAVNLGRLNMAMGAVGLCQACLDESVTFATQREQFGRPIAGFQLVQQMVVEIATLTQTARLLGYDAARALDEGGPGRYECSMAKYYCGESAGKAATLALQVHGGAGLMEESPVERLFRDAREATIPEGTTQIQILQLGRQLLGVSALR